MYVKKKYKENSHESVSKWYEFSMNPRTENEIREMVLSDPNSVCYSYICMKSKLSEQFIEELKVLSSELLSKELYTPENFKLVSDILNIKNLTERCNYVKKLNEAKLLPEAIKAKIRPDMVVRDKIDWRNIFKYQLLSSEFISNHQYELNEARRMHMQQDMMI